MLFFSSKICKHYFLDGMCFLILFSTVLLLGYKSAFKSVLFSNKQQNSLKSTQSQQQTVLKIIIYNVIVSCLSLLLTLDLVTIKPADVIFVVCLYVLWFEHLYYLLYAVILLPEIVNFVCKFFYDFTKILIQFSCMLGSPSIVCTMCACTQPWLYPFRNFIA